MHDGGSEDENVDENVENVENDENVDGRVGNHTLFPTLLV